MKIIILVILLFFTTLCAQAQKLTQLVRGIVVDKDSQIPLIGATIIRGGDDVSNGVITNLNGEFTLQSVPIGRQDFRISYVGYETYVVNKLLVGSGKEVVLNIELTETVTKIDEVVVRAKTRREKPLNDMASVSARVFSVEESKRYAGGFDDPMRLASSFAGVAAPSIKSNGISVRGNATSMLQYRMEGIEVDNANHFEGGDLLGGGFVSLFSNHMLANSDFLTGAFPAEYGNALSASFDMKMRTGNTQKYEHAFQLGVMGLDIASEGPIKKGSNASYLLNYRYSTFGLISNFLPEGEGLPVYQDLNFKINVPTKYGVFSLWGVGAKDVFDRSAKEAPSEWNMKDKRKSNNGDFLPAIIGINHKLILKNNAYINSAVAYNYHQSSKHGQWIADDLMLYDLYKSESINKNLTVSTFINKKFSSRHTNRTGASYKFMDFEYDEWASLEVLQPLRQKVDAKGSSALVQAYSQSKVSLTNSLQLSAGIHYQHFTLNNDFSLEPRLGIKQKISNKFSVSAAYGLHSRMQALNHYFLNEGANDIEKYPNKELGFTRAHHFVMAFDYLITKNTRLKVEPYYQILSDIPVIADSSFAIINLENDHGFRGELISEGTGRNIGIELTVERFLERGFYYLLTASVFDSKYKGGDGVERNTLYNTNFVANVLGGKEWRIGRNKNSLIGVNGRLYIIGGNRKSPVNYDLSRLKKDVIYDNKRLYEDQNPTTTRLDLTLSLTRNRPKYTSVFSIQLLNALGSTITYHQDYDFVQDKVVEMKGNESMPNVSWRIEF